MKKIILLLLLMSSFSVSATINSGGSPLKIKSIHAWADYNDNVTLLRLEAQHSECPGGYWFKAGPNTSMLSIALSAYHANTTVKVFADENSDFSGLATKECELRLIILQE